jgi:hypothetical protein
MLTQSRQLLEDDQVASSTVLQLEPDVLAERDRAAEEERQSLLARVTETLREWDRSLDQHLPEELQRAALRSHQTARRKAEEAGCLNSDIQAASGDGVNLPFVDAAGDCQHYAELVGERVVLQRVAAAAHARTLYQFHLKNSEPPSLLSVVGGLELTSAILQADREGTVAAERYMDQLGLDAIWRNSHMTRERQLEELFLSHSRGPNATQSLLLDEVEAALRHWDNVRFLGLDAEHHRKAMLWHIASVEAAKAGGCSGQEIHRAIVRASEPLEILLSPPETDEEVGLALADLRTISGEIDTLLEASPAITETDAEWIALDNRVQAAQEYALRVGCDQDLISMALTRGNDGDE